MSREGGGRVYRVVFIVSILKIVSVNLREYSMGVINKRKGEVNKEKEKEMKENLREG